MNVKRRRRVSRPRSGRRSEVRARIRPSPREARYQSLREDLESGHRAFVAGSYRGNDFFFELRRVCRADSRLLEHPIVREWLCNARAFGAYDLLSQLPGGLEKDIKRPLSAIEVRLFGKIDELRWGKQQDGKADENAHGASLTQQVKELGERRSQRRPAEIRVVPHRLGISIERAPRPCHSLAAIQKTLEARGFIRHMSGEGFRKLVQRLYPE